MNKFILAACIMLSACAAWQPTVNNPSAAYKEDYQYCDKLLGGYKANDDAILGAVFGGAVGLAVAGFTGADPALTAGMGAAMAGTGGYVSSDQKYRDNMIKCLKQQGHEVYE